MLIHSVAVEKERPATHPAFCTWRLRLTHRLSFCVRLVAGGSLGAQDNDEQIGLSAFQEWSRRSTLERLADTYLNSAWKAIIDHPTSATRGGRTGGSSSSSRTMDEVLSQLAAMQEHQAAMQTTQEALVAEIAHLNERLQQMIAAK